MGLERISGILLVIGSLAFMASASPIGGEVYGERDVDRQMEMISANPRGWALSQALFAISGILVVGGLWAFTSLMRQTPSYRPLVISSSLLTVGTVAWIIYVVWRTIEPRVVLSSYGTLSLPFASIAAYGLFTEAALVSLGIAFLRPGQPTWLGYVTLVLTGLLLLQVIAFRGGFIPLLFYLPTLIVGIVLTL